MAYWYYRWDWGESVALDGLARVAHVPGVTHFLEQEAQRWVNDSANGINRFGPARVVVADYTLRPNDATLAFLHQLRAHYIELPRVGDAILLDAPSSNIYVDSLYGDPVLLAELSAALDDNSLAAFAAQLALGHVRTLQLDTGLMAHVSDVERGTGPRIAWGRGNGWAALGLAELLSQIAPSVEGYPELLQRFKGLCDALLDRQVTGGSWRNLIDEPASYPEASATLLVTAAFNLGVGSGLLDDRHRTAAATAWATMEHRIDVSGHVVGVSYRPGVNSDPARYEHTPAVGMYPWGQGPYLIVATQASAVTEVDT